MLDNLALFEATINKGLWVDEPRDRRCSFVVSDFEGQQIARHSNRQTAVLKAYGKITKQIVNAQKSEGKQE